MIPASPVTVHFHTGCKSGPFISSSRLPSMVTAPTLLTLAKLCLQEILAASTDTSQIQHLLFGLSGDTNIVTAAGKNFTVCDMPTKSCLHFCWIQINQTRTIPKLQVKIPSNLQDNENAGMAEFLKTLCTSCRACQNLITLDPGPEQCNDCETQNTKRTMKMSDTISSPPSPKRERLSQSTADTNETSKPASSNGTSK